MWVLYTFSNNNNILRQCRWQKTDECKAIGMGYWIRVNLVSIWFFNRKIMHFYLWRAVYTQHSPSFITWCACVHRAVCEQSKCYRLSANFFFSCFAFFLILRKMTISIECTRQAANSWDLFQSLFFLQSRQDFASQVCQYQKYRFCEWHRLWKILWWEKELNESA